MRPPELPPDEPPRVPPPYEPPPYEPVEPPRLNELPELPRSYEEAPELPRLNDELPEPPLRSNDELPRSYAPPRLKVVEPPRLFLTPLPLLPPRAWVDVTWQRSFP